MARASFVIPPTSEIANSSAVIASPVITHERECTSHTFVIDSCASITFVQITQLIASHGRPLNTFGERLAFVRNARNLTQAELAASAGVSGGTIGNLESGLRIAPRRLLAIAEALGIEARWLESGEGHPESTPQTIADRGIPPVVAARIDHLEGEPRRIFLETVVSLLNTLAPVSSDQKPDRAA